MDLQLRRQTALVTASSGGIGLEIVRSSAREGATVILNGLKVARLPPPLTELRYASTAE